MIPEPCANVSLTIPSWKLSTSHTAGDPSPPVRWYSMSQEPSSTTENRPPKLPLDTSKQTQGPIAPPTAFHVWFVMDSRRNITKDTEAGLKVCNEMFISDQDWSLVVSGNTRKRIVAISHQLQEVSGMITVRWEAIGQVDRNESYSCCERMEGRKVNRVQVVEIGWEGVTES